VKFAQIPDRTAAEGYANRALRGHPLEDPDALWVHEMIGCRVVDADGTDRGVCVSVLANPAADLLELDTGALVPSNFVVSIDGDTIHVDTPDGLFDLDA
jgi:16S rRNA processing protein RimM